MTQDREDKIMFGIRRNMVSAFITVGIAAVTGIYYTNKQVNIVLEAIHDNTIDNKQIRTDITELKGSVKEHDNKIYQLMLALKQTK